VAARRLRSDLRTFRPLLDPAWARSLQGDLGAFTRAFGPVRDDDVLLDALVAVDADPALVAAIAKERAAHRRAMLRALDRPATTQLLDRLVQAAKEPRTAPQADDPADELLRPLARKPWRKLRRGIAGLDDGSTDLEFHEVRLLTKRFRYTAMAVAPAFGQVASDHAKALGKLQDALGERNDAHMMAERLRTSAGSYDAPVVFAAGEAVGRLRAAADRNRDAWKLAWKRASTRELRQWL
jgi:CHAD domain-containing protein